VIYCFIILLHFDVINAFEWKVSPLIVWSVNSEVFYMPCGHGRNFVLKCGGQLGVKPKQLSGRCRSDVFYIQIPEHFVEVFWEQHWSRFVLANYVHINILEFVAGRGAVVQPASINIVFGYKQSQEYNRKHHLGFIRALSWSAQNAESHWSHVHIILTVEHFTFHAFSKTCGLKRDLMPCSSRLTLQRR